MANLLQSETSPYLLQHRDNPVDWHPWGEQALEKARKEDLPILLSVGYSACHWCHVMEHESFEDEATAAFMNENFVNIKVDREERPDVDALYMEAVQGMTGRGGWPMTVFLDPEGVPFHGGTYFPPEPIGNMPSFRMVLEAVRETFRNRRDEIRQRSGETAAQLGALGRLRSGSEAPQREWLDEGLSAMMRDADQANGGFGGAPKFPPASSLELLLAHGREEFVELSLDRMMSGGIYDQVGGGFARYSVDATWMVPHFEKMLYDNALLVPLYLHGWQRLGRERYRRVVRESLDWALREMLDPSGGFHSALDADSEGVEGKFYVWEPEEARKALEQAGMGGDAIAEALGYLGVTAEGNFEGASVLHLARGASDAEPESVVRAKQVLFEARERRTRPGRDDKVIASWNGLMIGALAEAGAVLEEPAYLEAARNCAGMVLTEMRDGNDRLLRTYRQGEARFNAYLEDHAFLLEGLLTLYEATLEPRWYDAAKLLADRMIERFGDAEGGGFFTTAEDHERLIARRKDLGDHPIPAGNSSAALGLLRLSLLEGSAAYRTEAERVLRIYGRIASQNAEGFGHLLQALALYLGRPLEVALIAPDDQGAGLAELARVTWERHRPDLVRAGAVAGADRPPLVLDRPAVADSPTAYVCEQFSCQEPVTDPDRLRAQLRQA